ncbi:MAG TPA: MFS transporter [Caulobacteraceae bacterium]|nr:MFS transporter [Caulobacteraceae bacterium]
MIRGRPDLLRFVAARVLGGMAMQMTATALGWVVYERTNSAYALGLVALFQFIPAIPLVAVTGHVADSYDRRWVVSAAYAAQIVAGIALFGFDRSSLGMGWLYGLVLLMGATSSFAAPAQQSLLANLVPPEEISQAVAFSSSTNQLAVMAGPALGGLVFAGVGAWTFIIAAGLMLLGVALMQTIRPRPIEPDHSDQGVWERAFAGLAYVRSNPVLLAAITLDLLVVILAGVTSLLPIFARDILKAGPEGLGLLRSAPAVGAVIVGFTLARWPIKRHAGLMMLCAVGAFGLTTALFGVSRSLPLSLIFLAATGAFDMVSVVVRQTLVQVATPDQMRGRVSAVSSVFISGSNRLGDFESGIVAGLVGAPASTVIGGVGAMLVVLATAFLVPRFRRYDRLSPVVEKKVEPRAADEIAAIQ